MRLSDALSSQPLAQTHGLSLRDARAACSCTTHGLTLHCDPALSCAGRQTRGRSGESRRQLAICVIKTESAVRHQREVIRRDLGKAVPSD